MYVHTHSNTSLYIQSHIHTYTQYAHSIHTVTHTHTIHIYTQYTHIHSVHTYVHTVYTHVYVPMLACATLTETSSYISHLTTKYCIVENFGGIKVWGIRIIGSMEEKTLIN